jgi:hypothetical protein
VKRFRVLFAPLVLAAALVPAPGTAAEPAEATLSPTAREVTWTGGPFLTSRLVDDPFYHCTPLFEPSCDEFLLTIEPATTGTTEVTIEITPSSPTDNFDLYVSDHNFDDVYYTNTSSGYERLTIVDPEPGQYSVQVRATNVAVGATYTGRATMAAPTDGTESVRWSWDPAKPQASVEVPLRVVLVGFTPGEIDEAQLLADIPEYQQPGVLIPRGRGSNGDTGLLFGADTLVNHGRYYYTGENRPFLVPYEYRWKPQVVHAPEAFANGLMQAMAANSALESASGQPPLSSAQRSFLDRYNAERGVYRGLDKQVAAGAPVRYVNGEKVEDWVAANAEAMLGFPVGPKGGKKIDPGAARGYTVFILNTWDSKAALDHLKPQREYHYFKIDRIDPDTGGFEGINWARVWGGRYRFMMVDTGAAPNPYESETWGNRNRSVWGSATYDPPLWEFRANAPRPPGLDVFADIYTPITPTWDRFAFGFTLGRTVGQAASFRFLHSYLYEPYPGTGKFHLSDNVWHDKWAEQPWASDLTKLYDQETAIRGLSTLTPYFTFDGSVQFEYLAQGGPDYDADQANLDAAKQAGDDIAGTPHTAMHTTTTMDYLDSKPDRFLRGRPCATSVPGINVVVEKHYAWSLPVIVAGIATNRNGVPWGYMNSVSDLTKNSGADRDQTLAAAHPQPFSGTFTYTAIHEASHYLGLAHPHDSVGAARNEDGTPKYYDGFTWTYNTTAAPTTYSHVELVYSILDQESIARGHTAYYLRWSDDALADGGEAYAAAGLATVKQLPAAARRLRSEAIAAIADAEAKFASFDFVGAAFAAQAAWRSAAAYRDLALGLPAGTSELERGTKLAGAESCESAKKHAATHDHGH